MISIRDAVDSDIPAIVSLLRQSLGEKGSLRTEAYWRWKHIQNPFGRSRVLLAFEADTLMAVRAFMAWQFIKENQTINAWRAVDTAVHPNWQGKGLFTQLTMALLNQLESGPPSLIFNSPNPKSRAGYLKMGWESGQPAPLMIRIRPLNALFNRTTHRGSRELKFDFNLPHSFLEKWKSDFSHTLMTNWTPEAIRWRYQEIPGISYFSHSETLGDDFCLLIGRMVRRNGLNEMRITECIHSGNMDLFRSTWRTISQQLKPDAESLAVDGSGILARMLPFGFLPVTSLGPALTHRFVNDAAVMATFMNTKKRYLSAGTLELF